MGDVGAVLEVKWDIHNPIEVRDLGDALTALASRYDDFAKTSFGAKESDCRFYIQEIRKGSIIIEFVGLSVGLIDQALALYHFYGVLKQEALIYVSGRLPERHSNERGRDYAEIVRAVANSDSDDASLAFAYRETKSNGDEVVFALSKGEAKNLTTQVLTARESEVPKLSVEDETGHRRELMRLYQHNQDKAAGKKKRTNHKAIITKYDDKAKALLYETPMLSTEVAKIVSEEPYSELIFDVTVVVCFEAEKVKAYRLIEIHNSFLDDTPKQINFLDD